MSELGWLLVVDLAGCLLVAMLLTALTGTRRGGGSVPQGRA